MDILTDDGIKELMEKCPLLEEYAHFVAISRKYLAQGMERQGGG